MNKFIILIFEIIIIVNCETWYGEIKGSDRSNGKTGYAGNKNKFITAFYLCGERKYRVHFLGDKKSSWSKEKCCCEPVGDGRLIDGIAISGGKGYQVRRSNGWITKAYGYDINDDNNGYAGILGSKIDGVLIEGGEIYRVAYGEKPLYLETAEGIVANLFGLSKEYNFEKPTELIENDMISIKLILLNNEDIKTDGPIKLIIVDNKIDFLDFPFLGEDLNNIVKDVIKIDVIDLKSYLFQQFVGPIKNAEITVNFFWNNKAINFDFGIKIDEKHTGFRQGFRIIFEPKDNKDYIINTIKEILKIFTKQLAGDLLNKVTSWISELTGITFLNDIIPSLDDPKLSGFCVFVYFLGNLLKKE